MKPCSPTDRPLAAALLMLLCAAAPAGAQQPTLNPELAQEKHFLLRFVGELEAARHLLEQGRKASEARPDARVWFDYDRLNADLELIAQGIGDYLHGAGAGSPRVFQPISGDYQKADAGE